MASPDPNAFPSPSQEKSTPPERHGDSSRLLSGAPQPLDGVLAVLDVALMDRPVIELLDALACRVCVSFAADGCTVLVRETKTGRLLGSSATRDETEESVRIPAPGALGQQFLHTRRFTAASNGRGSSGLLHGEQMGATLSEPLRVEKKLLGLISVFRRDHDCFSDHDALMLAILAPRIAAVVERGVARDERIALYERQRDFVAVAAHELRAPTAAIYGISSTLARNGFEPTQRQETELRASLCEQSARLKALIERLLDLGRLDGGGVVVAPEMIRAHDVLGALVRAAVPERLNEVRLAVGSNLELYIDRHVLAHVVSNLIENAFRHGCPPVTLAARATNGVVRVTVEDRGTGVEPGLRPHVFERFKRGPGSRGQAGAGLGLAIAKSYAEAAGGQLLYSDAEPRGARFELVLPHRVRGGGSPAAMNEEAEEE
jgi:signal transduction histidine kinase